MTPDSQAITIGARATQVLAGRAAGDPVDKVHHRLSAFHLAGPLPIAE